LISPCFRVLSEIPIIPRTATLVGNISKEWALEEQVKQNVEEIICTNSCAKSKVDALLTFRNSASPPASSIKAKFDPW
jgi:hypothetical protein